MQRYLLLVVLLLVLISSAFYFYKTRHIKPVLSASAVASTTPKNSATVLRDDTDTDPNAINEYRVVGVFQRSDGDTMLFNITEESLGRIKGVVKMARGSCVGAFKSGGRYGMIITAKGASHAYVCQSSVKQ